MGMYGSPDLTGKNMDNDWVYCRYCGANIRKNFSVCPHCGAKQKTHHLNGCAIAGIVVLSIFALIGLFFCGLMFIAIIASTNSTEKTTISSSNNSVIREETTQQPTNNIQILDDATAKPSKEATIYNNDDILFKITSYEGYQPLFDGVTLKFYMENHTNKDVVFSIDSDVVIDGYTISGGLFYKEIKAGTKGTESFPVIVINKDGIDIDFKNMKSITFDYSIFESNNKKTIIKDSKYTYYFTK